MYRLGTASAQELMMIHFLYLELLMVAWSVVIMHIYCGLSRTVLMSQVDRTVKSAMTTLSESSNSQDSVTHVPGVFPSEWSSGDGMLVGGKSLSSSTAGQEMFKCAECETRFPTLDSLETHMMTHLGNAAHDVTFRLLVGLTVD